MAKPPLSTNTNEVSESKNRPSESSASRMPRSSRMVFTVRYKDRTNRGPAQVRSLKVAALFAARADPVDQQPGHIAHHHHGADFGGERRPAYYIHNRIERDGERHQARKQSARGCDFEPRGQAPAQRGAARQRQREQGYVGNGVMHDGRHGQQLLRLLSSTPIRLRRINPITSAATKRIELTGGRLSGSKRVNQGGTMLSQPAVIGSRVRPVKIRLALAMARARIRLIPRGAAQAAAPALPNARRKVCGMGPITLMG